MIMEGENPYIIMYYESRHTNVYINLSSFDAKNFCGHTIKMHHTIYFMKKKQHTKHVPLQYLEVDLHHSYFPLQCLEVDLHHSYFCI